MTKFNNRSTFYNGRYYHSMAEANYSQFLDSCRKAKDPSERVVDVEYQVNVPLVVNGKKICSYIPDFYVTFADGHKEYHEYKGFVTNVFLIKEKLFRALFPDEIFKVIRN